MCRKMGPIFPHCHLPSGGAAVPRDTARGGRASGPVMTLMQCISRTACGQIDKAKAGK